MTTKLSAEHESMIRAISELGSYDSTDDVIEDALRLLDQRLRSEDLWRKLQVGIRQIEEGDTVLWSPEWSAQRLANAKRRLAAGDIPNPDVWP